MSLSQTARTIVFENARSERVLVAVALLLIAAALTASTFGLQFAELGGAFSPTFFPRIILIALVGLALINVAVDLRHNVPKAADQLTPVALIALALIAYVNLLSVFGYFLCSFVLSVLMLLILGLRKPLAILMLSALVPGSLVLLFNHLLKMPLPTSPFVWWL